MLSINSQSIKRVKRDLQTNLSNSISTCRAYRAFFFLSVKCLKPCASGIGNQPSLNKRLKLCPQPSSEIAIFPILLDGLEVSVKRAHIDNLMHTFLTLLTTSISIPTRTISNKDGKLFIASLTGNS